MQINSTCIINLSMYHKTQSERNVGAQEPHMNIAQQCIILAGHFVQYVWNHHEIPEQLRCTHQRACASREWVHANDVIAHASRELHATPDSASHCSQHVRMQPILRTGTLLPNSMMPGNSTHLSLLQGPQGTYVLAHLLYFTSTASSASPTELMQLVWALPRQATAPLLAYGSAASRRSNVERSSGNRKTRP